MLRTLSAALSNELFAKFTPGPFEIRPMAQAPIRYSPLAQAPIRNSLSAAAHYQIEAAFSQPFFFDIQ
jgi:hypothetical protein